MSSSAVRATFDFSKLKEVDKREDRYDENLTALFEENGLHRKRLSKGSDSLMRAVSEAIYFDGTRHQEIQQLLLTHLTQLIATNSLTPRLSNFQGSSMMLKDFANNPQLPGFEKTNLELVSLYFKVRIVLYTMNEDHYLAANIFNNNHPKTIELLRTRTNHYDAVFAQSFIQKAGVCQNIILNLIDKAVNGNRSDQHKNLNNDEYVNIAYESSIAAAKARKDSSNLDQFRITRGHHKKSLSDNFNTNFELMEEQQMKFYDAFMNSSPPDDLLKTFNTRKDTAESGFSINANFDFIDEQNLETPFQAQNFAIKNYPIASNGLSPKHSNTFELDSPMPAFSKAKFSSHPNVLFNENLSLAEIERLEKTINTATTQDSKQIGASPFFLSSSPPGLSPAKFTNRSFTDTVQTPKSDFLSPTMPREALSPGYPYTSASPVKRSPFGSGFKEQSPFNQQSLGGQSGQPFAPQAQSLNAQSQAFTLSQQFNRNYMKKGGMGASMSVPPTLPEQMDDFNMGQSPMRYDQAMGFSQAIGYDQVSGFESGLGYDEGMGFGQGFDNTPKEKKKPIILDESQERYDGRLKFFDENKKYGFIVMDEDGSDIFVHYDDLCKAGITKDLLRTARMGNLIRLNFGCMAYIGKYNRSRKAIDIQLVM